jgi:diacylglycerol kinase family enzyme
LLAVPGGTRNHFARDLDIVDLDAAAEIADHGSTRTIDVGQVNDLVFVNNSSIGVYPRLVEQREARESDLSKGLAAVVAAWHQLRRGRKLQVDIDGTSEKVWAVFVGNNRYGDSLRDLGREKLDEGLLDVRIARADGRFSRWRIVLAVLFGRIEHSRLIDRRQCASVTIEQSVASMPVALDGEVTDMKPPLRYTSKAKALTVLVSGESP